MEKIDKKINFALYTIPVLIVLLLFVMFKTNQLRSSQVENVAFARSQRDLGIQKEDTIIRKQDTIILLFKSIKKIQ